MGEVDDWFALLAWWLLAFTYQDVEIMTDEELRDELRSYGIDPAQVHAAPTTKQ